jgi:hypothetical protein
VASGIGIAVAVAVVVGVLAVRPAEAVPRADATARPPVVVVGTAGLRWSDVDTSMPQLWKLAGDAALGSLSVKAADPVSCPDDGWLTLGAGNRASAHDRSGSRCVAAALDVRAANGGKGAVVEGFDAAYRRNVHRDDNTHLGALAQALNASGECISAAGSQAALAAADPRGHVAVYRSDVLAATADPAFLRQCPVTLVAATPSELDRVVSLVSANASSGTVLLAVGVSETDAGTAHLHVALAHGPGFASSALVSASTRRAPFVQLVDVAPTVLALRGDKAPNSMIGQPWRSTGVRTLHLADEVGRLARLDTAAQRQAAAVVPFWVSLVVLMLAAAVLAWWVARCQLNADAATPAPSAKLMRFAELACAWAALLPAASFLAGIVAWWSAPLPLLVLGAATVVAASVATAFAVGLERWIWARRPFGMLAAVGTITFTVIGLDLLTGAHLQIFTMAGYSPLVAGRFAGIGNVGFGVFAAGAIVTGAGLAEVARRSDPTPWRRFAAGRVGWVAALVGVAAVVVDGGPAWGSDVGGVLALVPAFAVLAWLLAGIRISWRKSVGVALAAVGVIAVFAVLDYARPAAHQTHLGRFVGDLLHGGAWAIIRRKALSDVRLLGYSVLTLLIPVMVAVAIWLVRAPRPLLRRAFAVAHPLRPAIIALLVTCVVGAVLNDSGIVIPALAVLVVLPGTMAAIVASARVATRVGEADEPPASLLP